MNWMRVLFLVALLAVAHLEAEPVTTELAAGSPYRSWSHGPSTEPGYFPIAVWLQDPRNAVKYRAAGFNTYVGLWKGPTEEQLAMLKQAGMRVICEQNEVALRRLDDDTIMGWMHGDEPDNAQSLGAGLGWGDPVAPERIVADYQRIQQRDPSRPVLLNLGQGVAWDDYYGRGKRTRHPEDYPRYLAGADVVSFDIYPAVHDRQEVAGKLWYVARGVERLVRWGQGAKPVWNCLECTRISNVSRKPTPHEVKAEAWMSIIHGSRGLIYFVHQFKPVFREPALLDDAEMLTAVGRLNHQISSLASVLNAGRSAPQNRVESLSAGGKVALLARELGSSTYLFAVEMQGTNVTARFTHGGSRASRVEVLHESRSLPSQDGVFQDHFDPWEVHIYRISSKP